MFNLFEKRQINHRTTWLLMSVLLGASAVICAGSYASTRAKIYTINIEAMQFSPKLVEVNVGDTVIWKNSDLVTHTATADNKKFSSGEIPINHSWKFVARKKGTFTYFCTLHPTMKGTLVVK